MHHIIYLSRATVPFNDGQLAYLLRRSRTRNAELGITGMLLYGKEQFVQLIEGEAAAVQKLYVHICQDPRHRAVTTFTDKTIARRSFSDWAMAYHPMQPQQFRNLVGLVSPDDLALDATNLQQTDQNLLQLLRAFLQVKNQ